MADKKKLKAKPRTNGSAAKLKKHYRENTPNTNPLDTPEGRRKWYDTYQQILRYPDSPEKRRMLKRLDDEKRLFFKSKFGSQHDELAGTRLYTDADVNKYIQIFKNKPETVEETNYQLNKALVNMYQTDNSSLTFDENGNIIPVPVQNTSYYRGVSSGSPMAAMKNKRSNLQNTPGKILYDYLNNRTLKDDWFISTNPQELERKEIRNDAGMGGVGSIDAIDERTKFDDSNTEQLAQAYANLYMLPKKYEERYNQIIKMLPTYKGDTAAIMRDFPSYTGIIQNYEAAIKKQQEKEPIIDSKIADLKEQATIQDPNTYHIYNRFLQEYCNLMLTTYKEQLSNSEIAQLQGLKNKVDQVINPNSATALKSVSDQAKSAVYGTGVATPNEEVK